MMHLRHLIERGFKFPTKILCRSTVAWYHGVTQNKNHTMVTNVMNSSVVPAVSIKPGVIVYSRHLSFSKITDIWSPEVSKYHETKGELAYNAPLSTLIRQVKAFSLFTSVVGLGLQPVLLLKLQESTSESIVLQVAAGAFLSFFIFATPVLIHWMTRKYVTHMYYNSDTERFSANTISFFLRSREHQFTAEDVVVPNIPGMFTSIVVNKRPFFIDPKFFLSKSSYIKLMKYDEPMDLNMQTTEDSNK